MAFTKYIIALGFILPSLAFSSVEECSMRRDPFEGMSNLQKHLCQNAVRSGVRANIEMACGNQTNVAWYSTRDNSMAPARDRVGRAMGIIRGQSGTSMAVQVCPGVYLASAHGVLKQGNTANHEAFGIFGFPLSRETRMSVSNEAQLISPWLRDPSRHGEGSSDYVFIKVDSPIRSEYIEPAFVEQESDLIDLDRSNQADFYLYRGKTAYNKDSSGVPLRDAGGVFDSSELVSGRALLDVYDEPQKVQRECSLSGSGGGLVGHDCPTESGVSGAPIIANYGGSQYLAGLHVGGTGTVIEDSNSSGGGYFVQSKEFCSDYEAVCGKPCVNLNESIAQEQREASQGVTSL